MCRQKVGVKFQYTGEIIRNFEKEEKILDEPTRKTMNSVTKEEKTSLIKPNPKTVKTSQV